MTKILRLGDPHITPSNIKESEVLMSFVLSQALELKIDRLEILGDLFHTMSVVRLECIQFWDKWFDILNDQEFETVVLIGNHDMLGDYSNDFSALHPFVRVNSKLKIVMSACQLGVYGYLPYIHDNQKFIENAKWLADHGCRVLVSHTTYQGSTFDNGLYAPDGVDPNLVDPEFIHLISGHIHSEQSFGRVWYPGTARWFSASCANKQKGLWLCIHDETGLMLSKEFISTENIVTSIRSFVWKENEERPIIPENAKVSIELVGSSNWVTEQKLELKGLASLSSKITDIKKSSTRRSGKSLVEFLQTHYQTSPDKREKLIKYMDKLNLG